MGIFENKKSKMEQEGSLNVFYGTNLIFVESNKKIRKNLSNSVIWNMLKILKLLLLILVTFNRLTLKIIYVFFKIKVSQNKSIKEAK